MKRILGISAFYHDAAAALTVDGRIIAAAQEERFTRQKNTPDFPVHAIQYCLDAGKVAIDALDAVVFYDKPFLKFERLLETYYAFAPRGVVSFVRAMPVWIREKLFAKKMILDGLRSVGDYDKKKIRLLFSEHHLSHAASAFFPSPYEQAAILTIDGVGEWCTASIGMGDGRQITFLKEMSFPHSVGLLYSSFTYYLGFSVNSGEYKLMGLAPYGHPESAQTKTFIDRIKTNLVDIKQDGSVWLNQSFFHYATGLTMVKEKKWEKLFGFPRRLADTAIEQSHCNLAYAIQNVTEDIIMKMAGEARRLTGADALCLAGGVALNCVAGGKLLRKKIFKDIFIQPAAGDAGGAVGAALAAHHIYFEHSRTVVEQSAQMSAYLGPAYENADIEAMNRRFHAVATYYENFGNLAESVAGRIAEGSVVGWFQGRMEFGPRALGNRSILGDARHPDMQKKMNLKIKYREGFRPFAPSVLAEEARDYFDLETDSPYMLLIAYIHEQRRHKLPDHYFDLPPEDKLNVKRSDVPAVTHLDFSARVQTVRKEANPRFWQLIRAFKERTGCGLIINTSFNVRGEPMVCTPEDAYRCFMSTEMDYLVMNDFVYAKTQQPDFRNKDRWKTRIQRNG
jgi:carbamoyltransferase